MSLPMAIAVALVGLAAIIGYWRRQVVFVGATALGGLVAGWAFARIAVRGDWWDADGFGDCYPSCDPYHYLVSFLYQFAPETAVLLVVVFAVLGVVESRSPGGDGIRVSRGR